jgi:hypothetical protein
VASAAKLPEKDLFAPLVSIAAVVEMEETQPNRWASIKLNSEWISIKLNSETVELLDKLRQSITKMVGIESLVDENALEKLVSRPAVIRALLRVTTSKGHEPLLYEVARELGFKVAQQQVPQSQQQTQPSGDCTRNIELKVELPQFFTNELKKCEEVKARYNRLANELDDVARRLAEQGIVPKNADFKVFFSPSEKVLQQLSKAERDKVEEIKKLRPQFSRCNIINGIAILEEARVESLGKLLRGEYSPAELDKTVVESLFNDDKTLRLFENAVRSELARAANELVINDPEFMLKVLAGVRTAEVKNMHGKPGTFALLFRLGCSIAQATINDPEVERYKTYINSICKEVQDLTDRLEQDYKVEWEE